MRQNVNNDGIWNPPIERSLVYSGESLAKRGKSRTREFPSHVTTCEIIMAHYQASLKPRCHHDISKYFLFLFVCLGFFKCVVVSCVISCVRFCVFVFLLLCSRLSQGRRDFLLRTFRLLDKRDRYCWLTRRHFVLPLMGHTEHITCHERTKTYS